MPSPRILLHLDGFNGSTTIVDSSTYGSSITVGGGASLSTSKNVFGGSSLTLNGTDAYLGIDGIGLATNQDFCYRFWFNSSVSTSAGVYKCLIGRDAGSFNTPGEFGLFLNNGTANGPMQVWLYDYSNASPFLTSSTSNINDGTWHFIEFSRTGGTFYLFDNGVLAASAAAPATVEANSGTLYIGHGSPAGNATNRFVDGYIDEIAIWIGTGGATSGYLPPAGKYQPDGSVLVTPSVLLHADGANGQTTDVNYGTGTSTISFTGSSISTAQSKFGGSSYYGAGNTSSYVGISDSSSFEIGAYDFTVEAWVYIAGNSPLINSVRYGTIFGCRDTQKGWYLCIAGDGTTTGTGLYLEMDTYSGSTSYITVSANMTISQSALHHIEISRSGTTYYMFVDGVLYTPSIGSGGPSPSHSMVSAAGSGTLFINSYPGFEFPFNGYIDEFVITKGVCKHTANFTPPTAPYLADGTMADYAGALNSAQSNQTSAGVAGNVFEVSATTSSGQSEQSGVASAAVMYLASAASGQSGQSLGSASSWGVSSSVSAGQSGQRGDSVGLVGIPTTVSSSSGQSNQSTNAVAQRIISAVATSGQSGQASISSSVMAYITSGLKSKEKTTIYADFRDTKWVMPKKGRFGDLN